MLDENGMPYGISGFGYQGIGSKGNYYETHQCNKCRKKFYFDSRNGITQEEFENILEEHLKECNKERS